MIRKKETSRDYKDLTENAIFWQVMDNTEELEKIWRTKHLTRKDLIKISKTLNNLLCDIVKG